MSQNGIPYARLGLSKAQFDALLNHQQRSLSNSESLSGYLKSEEGVKALTHLVRTTRNDPKLCGLILAIIDQTWRELAEEEAREKAFRKKYQHSTIGMF